MSTADVFQLFGLIFVGAGLGMLAAPAFYSRMLENAAQTPVIIYISGVLRLAIGYLLVRYFTFWGWDWRLLLTLLGWLALIVGFLTLLLPEKAVALAARMSGDGKSVKAYGIGAAVIGVIFLIIGFGLA